MFDSKQLTSKDIYNLIHEQFPTKTAEQIRNKFENLRRQYSKEKLEKIKSGAAGGKTTIVDDEMNELWSKRKKFEVAKTSGNMDTAQISQDKEIALALNQTINNELSLEGTNI